MPRPQPITRREIPATHASPRDPEIQEYSPAVDDGALSETKTMCSDRIPFRPTTEQLQAIAKRMLADWDANVQAYVNDGWELLSSSEVTDHPSRSYRKLEVLTRPKHPIN
jgi:hypothetical protein